MTSATASTPGTTPRSLPYALRFFLFAIFSFDIASLGYNLIARALGYGIPYSFAYFFAPQFFFSDLFEFRERFHHYGRPEFFTQHGYFMYPPGMTLPYAALLATPSPRATFFALTLATVLFFVVCLFRALRTRGVEGGSAALLSVGIAVTSYPLITVLLRTNLEIFVWIVTTCGLWSVYRRRYIWAAVFFGFATAFKIYPFLFFSLLLAHRRYRELAIGILTVLGVTWLALRLLSPHVGYALRWDLDQLRALGGAYVAAPVSLGYDHSFFALIKFATLPWLPNLAPLVRPYTWIVAVGGLVFYFTRINKLPLVNQFIILSVLAVTIAPVSYDYTLLSLYPSLALLCLSALDTAPRDQGKLVPFFLLYATILTPQSYIILHRAHFYGELRALCLLVLVILAAVRLIPDRTSGAENLAAAPLGNSHAEILSADSQ
ncbi:MAG TPA: glycosyltransferase family 87 protein [Acidobacteriaceae bacterium]